MDDNGGSRPKITGERVDRGLGVAFGGDGESILDALERLNGVQSRVLLEDLGGDDSPVVRVMSKGDDEKITDDSRYQILGEIARGGVGVILKSRDRDLGRDVALKVLKKDLAQIPEVVQRFVEEAQIEGQLQHPGIVPVYGLGVQKDGRPYFAMKLVKGETLAALIRSGGRSARSRHISAFEKICQTVAYAHARRVLHRDLKPANVLVGSFGEVQVVDWGFAKVLTRGGVADEHREEEKPEKPDLSVIETIRTGSTGSESRVGSIMGTPGYMPPEQARGETAKIDERADVFSLGAILTEILTGKPPYTGKVAQQIQAAAKAKLRPAKDRLDKCGADPQLIDLAKQCLAPAIDARPRHAGEVAEAITSYLTSQEVRRRKAEMRAAAEKRTRKLSLALAATVLLAVILGGGGYYTAETARRNRTEAARTAVDGALREAGVFFGKAQSADPETLEVWIPAVTKAAAAVELAEKLDSGEETRTEAAAFLGKVKSAQATARRLAAIVADDRKFSAELWEVRLSRFKNIKPVAKNRNYGIYFRARNIDIEADRPERVAEWIRQRTIRSEIVAVLDDWANRLRKEGKTPTRINTILGLLDDDELRGKIRGAAAYDDLTKLTLIRKDHDPAKLPVETLLLLAETYGNSGDAATAVDLYRILEEREKGSFRTTVGLGHWLMMRVPPRYQEATKVLARAAKMSDASVPIRQMLAHAHGWTGDVDASIAALREVHARVPEFEPNREALATALTRKATVYRDARNYRLAADFMKEAVEFLPSRPQTLSTYANLLLQAKRPAQAAAAAEKLIGLRESYWVGHLLLGDARRMQGRPQDALKAYDRARIFMPGSSRIQRERGRTLARLGELEKAIQSWKRAEELEPEYWEFWFYIGRACLRLERFDEATEAFDKAREYSPADAGLYHWLGVSRERAGDAEAARRWQDKAIEYQRRSIALRGSLVRRKGYTSLGYYVCRRHGAEKALEFWRRRFPGEPDATRALFLCGVANVVASFHGDARQASAILEAVLRDSPESGTACLNLAALYGLLGEHRKQLTRAREAASLLQGFGQSLTVLRVALQVNGRIEEARRITELLAQDLPSWETSSQTMDRIVNLSARLDQVRSGSLRPSNAEEYLAFANALVLSGHVIDAWSMLERHLRARQPEEEPYAEARTRQQLHAMAAGIALRAARGEDATSGRLSPRERDLWLGRAVGSLGLLLEALESQRPYLILEAQATDSRSYSAVTLKTHPQYAIIRDEARIAGMPPELQAKCRELWARVDVFWKSVR